MNRQHNGMIKPLKLDNSNKLLNKLFPSGEKKPVNRKPDNLKKIAPTSMHNLDDIVDYSSEDIDDDSSSISSIESDCYEINIWDNSELRLREINTEYLIDKNGNRLSFLQLYKIRSSFYTKNVIPQLGDIFKNAEKIHKFCGQKLNLDDFLEEEARYNLLDIELCKDKNFCKFSRYFEQQLDLNRQKQRDEKYDRYDNVQMQGFDSPDSGSSPIQGRESVFIRNKERMMSGLNLSPLRPLQKRLILDVGKDINNANNVRKTQLNLLQLSEIQRKQKVQFTQQKSKQDQQLQQKSSLENNIHLKNQSQFSIPELEVFDNQASTSVSHNQMSNSSCESQQDQQFKINKNSNQINFKISESSYSNSPLNSPKNNNSSKNGSPYNNQKSPIVQQNEFRLKLQNANEICDAFTLCSGEDNQKKLSQINQSSSNKQTPCNNKEAEKIYGMSSFTKFISSSQQPKKRPLPNSQNATPLMKQSQKLSSDFNSMNKQQQQTSPLLNSTYFKNNQSYQQQSKSQQSQLLNNKSNLNSSTHEVRFPTLDKVQLEKKQSIKPSPEYISRLSGLQINHQSSQQSDKGSPILIQNYNISMSPQKKPQTPFSQNTLFSQNSSILQQKNNFQRFHRKFQSTIVNEEQKLKLKQLVSTKF